MKIYEVEGDYEYLWVNCVADGMCGRLDHVVSDGAWIDRNEPIELEISDWDAPGDWVETDCPPNPADGTLLFSERAVAVLGDLLLGSGYFIDTILPVQTRYKIFICEREIDAIDRERSEIVWFEDADNIDYVLRYAFHDDVLLDRHVFRLKYLRATVLESDVFVRRAEAHQLTGFIFKELWSSETGGVRFPVPFPWNDDTDAAPEPRRDPVAKRAALRAVLAARQQPGG